MSMIMLLTLAAAIPEVPPAVHVVQEGRAYVMRNVIDDSPLYTFDRDEPGKSNCTAACAAAWLPFRAQPDARPVGEWAPIKRDDGTLQWSYGGWPVYSFYREPEVVATASGPGNWLPLSFPAP